MDGYGALLRGVVPDGLDARREVAPLMCGIAFLRAPAVSSGERRERMGAALQRLKHRGPDESGCFDGDDFVAGHTRLAIIDLKGGQQPVRDPGGRWLLV